jgi:hypothetical protein
VGQQVADCPGREHRARPDPAHLEAVSREQLAELLGAVAAGDRAVEQGDEHYVGVRHVDEVRPAVLFGEQRHAERERVHAGEHLPAGAQHPRDLGDERFGGQVPRQRAVFGDHAVRAAVGEEFEVAAVGGYRAQPAGRLAADGAGA